MGEAIGVKLSTHLILKFFLAIFALTNVIRRTESKLFIDVISVAKKNSYVVYTNGSILNRPIDKDWLTCGIGSGIVFLVDPNGDCYDTKAFSITRGSVNLISVDNLRDRNYNQDFTVIDARIADGEDTITRSCVVPGLLAGERIGPGDVTTTGNASYSTGVIPKISLPRGTSVTLKVPGICCSCTTLNCGITITAGNTADFAICSKGLGKKAFVYDQNKKCNLTGGTCVFGNPSGIDAYLPTETNYSPGTPMAVTFNTYLTTGMHSRPWDNGFSERETEAQTGVGRRKLLQLDAGSFILATAAMAEATYAVIELGKLKDAVNAGFEVTDRNDRKIFAELVIHEQEIFYNLQQIVWISERDRETDLGIGAINADSEKYNELFEAIVYSLDSLVDYTLYFTNFYTIGFATLENSMNQALDQFKVDYPNRTIVMSAKGTVSVKIYSVEGDLLTGDCEKSYCDGKNCQLEGKFTHFQSKTVANEEENPYLTIGSCGIYSEALSTSDYYTVFYTETFKDRIKALEKAKAKFCYVLESDCYVPMNLTNALLTETRKVAETVGFKTTMSPSQEYYITCEDVKEDYQTVMAENGLACESYYSAQSLRDSLNTFHRINFTLESAAGAFNKALADSGFGSLGSIFGSIFDLSVTAKLVIVLLVVVVIEGVAIGFLYYKTIFDTRASMVREMGP